jgi:hypothetical protein
VTKPPRLFVALYRATVRLQPAARRRQYGDEQIRLAEELWANERPAPLVGRVIWSLQILIRALWAALGSHLDLHGAGGLLVPCKRARLAVKRHPTREGRDLVAAVQAVSDRERFTLAARLGAIFTDARYSLRTLRRTPAYTIAAVLVIALGVGTARRCSASCTPCS